MRYKNNEQVKDVIKKLMADENVSYRDLAEKIGTSQQNIYSILNKKQLKLDDVNLVCKALGYTFDIRVVKEDGVEDESFDLINEEVLRLLGQLIKIAKETDINSVRKYHSKKKE